MSQQPPPAGAAYSVAYQPRGPSGPRASFGQRFGAFLIDWLIVSAPLTVLFLIAFLAWAAAVDDNVSSGADAAAFALFALTWVIGIVAPLLYEILLEGGPSGQTVGKKAVGIRVVSWQTGGPIGYGKATVSALVRNLGWAAICWLGFLWMLWDDEKQTWHDKIADTVVVPVSAYPITR